MLKAEDQITLTQAQEGELWSAIRLALAGNAEEPIKRALAATRYEEASAHWDDAARKIAHHVERRLRGESPTLAESQAAPRPTPAGSARPEAKEG